MEGDPPQALVDRRDRLVARMRKVGDSVGDGVGEGRGRLTRLADRLRDEHAQRSRSASGATSPSAPPTAQRVPSGDLEPPDEEAWALSSSFATYLLADAIARRSGGDRGEKMARVVEKLHVAIGSLLSDADFDGDIDADDAALLLVRFIESWQEADRLRFMIDLSFGDPFFPFSLKVRQRDFEQALQDVAERIGVGRNVVAEIGRTRKSAQEAHRSVSWAKIGVFGAGGVLLLGTGAFALAPVVGGLLGAGAGLYGAVGTAYGLALLGGGPLAAGGAGMAGGLWLVTGVGAAAGLVGGGGGAALHEMGARQAGIELTRLQVTFKMTILADQTDTLKAQLIISSLQEQLDGLSDELDEEIQLNDENSSRIKDLKEKIETIEESIDWMKHEKEVAV